MVATEVYTYKMANNNVSGINQLFSVNLHNKNIT